MSSRRAHKKQDVWDEPHLKALRQTNAQGNLGASSELDSESVRFDSDDSELWAQEVLNQRRSNSKDMAAHSIHNELAILPLDHQSVDLIDRDWLCDRCGYNLRGLPVGEPCPECRYVQFSKPGRLDQLSQAQWLEQNKNTISDAKRVGMLMLLVCLGGLFAVLGTFVGQSMHTGGAGGAVGMLAVVFFGPTIEELMKIAAVAYLVETRPYWLKGPSWIWIATLAGAFGFAAIENALYLLVYIPNPEPWLVAWRWTVCVALHTGATAIATVGLVRCWQNAMVSLRPSLMKELYPWLVAAIVVHGVYNGLMVMLEVAGVF